VSLLHAALAFAAECHKEAVRDGRDSLPYLHHPLDVANILRWEAGITNQEVLCAALLHDTIEEGGAQIAEIQEKFGLRVAELVDELTRTEPSPEETAGKTKEEIYQLRTEMMLKEIRIMSQSAGLIKLADRLSNLREAVLVRTPKKLLRYKEQTRLILQEIPREISPQLWDTLAGLCD
jgi:guanosine-3',5'-bis(diphosphate) 3'-pyrophosphohydrolase